MKHNIVVSQRWIPVEEALPEQFEDVLTYRPDDPCENGGIDLEWVDMGGGFSYESLYGKPTHWMPLPKPPKGVQ